jgi:hypothetical protein
MGRPQAGELDALAQANLSPDEISALGLAVADRLELLHGEAIVARSQMKPSPEGVAEEIAALRSVGAKILAAYADRDL